MFGAAAQQPSFFMSEIYAMFMRQIKWRTLNKQSARFYITIYFILFIKIYNAEKSG